LITTSLSANFQRRLQHTGNDCLILSPGANYHRLSALEPAFVIVIAASTAIVFITVTVSAFMIMRFKKKRDAISDSKYS
jgi:hypothetical protein